MNETNALRSLYQRLSAQMDAVVADIAASTVFGVDPAGPPLVTMMVRTRKPEKYVLVDTETNERWVISKDWKWVAEGVSDEPPKPKPCSNCGMSYDACTTRVLQVRGACCGTCGSTATHEQNAWEQWDREQNRG